MTNQRAVCIHGHFYQPPRENPWIEAIEVQDSAAPFHDWNERVTAECYAPNTAARILNGGGNIRRIVNNYARISFNVGPTLLSWMEDHAPHVYGAILDADHESRRFFSGHGSAIAQAHSHPILPLANDRDKETQIRWGLADFELRFGRPSEGLWLPETAVDLPTLEIVARLGIRFVILAPHQIRRVRPLGEQAWQDVAGSRVNPRMPYLLTLPSEKTIAVFPYDGPIAHDVSFGRLLEDGERFLQRLLSAFGASSGPQLVHVATDGEAYGHHHRFGEMALAYVLDRLEKGGAARLANYGEWLERHPPTHEAEIVGNTSWSCVHGLERWRSDCGCNGGSHPGWNQSWREPLRRAFDRLRDELAPRYEERAGRLFADPWGARDAYIEVLLDRSPETTDAFLAAHARSALSETERIEAWKLLELQRHAMLMYTSCGWFFDDLAGIETVQVLRYAGRAIGLANDLFGEGFEEPFLSNLETASSNDPARGDGRAVYDALVRPSVVDLPKVVAHHALTAPFSGDAEDGLFSTYQLETVVHDERRTGNAFLGVGRTIATFVITGQRATIAYAALHAGDTEIAVGVRFAGSDEVESATAAVLLEAFERGALDDVRAGMEKEFSGQVYSLPLLFREEQRRLLSTMMERTLLEIEAAYRRDYERAEPLLRLLADLGIPIPRTLRTLAAFMINSDLEETVAAVPFDGTKVAALVHQAQEWDIALDRSALADRWREGLERAIRRLAEDGPDRGALESLLTSVDSARDHTIDVDLWSTQNAYYRLAGQQLPSVREQADAGDTHAAEWLKTFDALGKRLAVDAPSPDEDAMQAEAT